MTRNNLGSPQGEVSIAAPRPLPVLVLADVSGSMAADGKITALNDAIREMVASFSEDMGGLVEVHVAIVTFGGTARLHQSLTPARNVTWTPALADGKTPLGAALDLVRGLIDDVRVIPSRAYRPYVVLASDGQPNDEWKGPLQALLSSERGKKAIRIALAIGDDANETYLRAFLADPEAKVYRAHEARDIRRFFDAFTMTVTTRSRVAQGPAAAPLSAVIGFDE